CLQDYSLPWTF
nr:immunoglobulin light chain junction region [Macaca mulatta]MOV60924.1 immunoglobulin light chain junction region [Macaca mulatta]MOV60938.1 immunoglobulin light chain junction region [Macaca mulatta]MOV60964.1 immunoglobulin light chain junction region [Macaca mulatta]MOV60972.1 immunoglobulin light chain junction region [Macaca mulatta]